MTATPQCMQALACANEKRLAVAQFKRDLRPLAQDAAVHLVVRTIQDDHQHPLLGAARVKHLILAIDRVGEHKAAKVMIASQIYNYDKRLRDLTARQRGLLVTQLLTAGWRSSNGS